MLQKFFGCLLAIAFLGFSSQNGFAAGGGFHGGGGGMGGSGHSGVAFGGGHAFGGRSFSNHGAWGRGWRGSWHNGRFGFSRGRFFRRGGRFFFQPAFVGFGFYGFGYPYWGWDYPGWDYSYYGDPYYYGDPSYYGDPGYSYYPGNSGQGNYVYRGQAVAGNPRYSYSTTPGNEDTAVQIALKRRGYYQGQIDGQLGDASRAAIRRFQSNNDLPVTGEVDSKLLQSLRISTANR